MSEGKKIAIKVIFVVILIISFVSFGKGFLNILESEYAENPYYYTKAMIKEKHKENGILGSEKHYIKIELADGTNKIINITTENFLLAELDQEIFIVLDTEKNNIEEIIFNDIELNKYIDSQNEIGRGVKTLY